MEGSSEETQGSAAALVRRHGGLLLEALTGKLPDAGPRAEIAATLAGALATELAPEDGEAIAEAARLQEIGKLYLPAALLELAADERTAAQRRQFDSHYEHGRELARGAGVPERACTWILHAREHWDGSGTAGLSGEEIPIGSRIIAVTREYLDAPLTTAGSELDPRAAALRRLGALAGWVLDPSVAVLAVRLAGD